LSTANRGSKRDRLPDFLIIGAAKSATTSLHVYLNQHPEIFMSRLKEPNFFAFDGSLPRYRGPDYDGWNGLAASRQRLEVAKYRLSVTKMGDYVKLFSGADEEQTVGESSVLYMYAPRAAERIKRCIPEIKLVAILRHPVDRAYSKFLQFRKDGCEPIADFCEALEAEEERVRQGWSPTWFYKRRGLYGEQLERYFKSFDRGQIRVYLYDRFCSAPLEVMRDIFRFLSVDETFTPDVSRRFNRTEGPLIVPRSKFLHRRYSRNERLKAAARRLLSRRQFDRLKDLLVGLNTREKGWMKYPPLSESVRMRLIEEFRPDILKLQDLIGLDLSCWLA
jgi:hypothetical protein